MSHSFAMISSKPQKPLSGVITVPGDKSISHRAIMFGAIAIGTTRIQGLLTGTDVLHTAKAMQSFGADIQQDNDDFIVTGVGVGGLREPEQALDFGNAGTGVRLAMGLVATHNITAIFHGDASLCKRPMGRILEPLRLFGAKTLGRSGDKLPLALSGTEHSVPITYRLPMASAQVKSAILLAGLNTLGTTTVIEPIQTRDHTEKMLEHFGANIKTTQDSGDTVIELSGYATLKANDIVIPADPSSAAFPICAALIVPDSQVTITNVLMNPTRTGLFDTLIEMGADITYSNSKMQGKEYVCDITARYSNLTAVTIPNARVASMIDEFPILAIIATQAQGTTKMQGIGELRFKESDRINAICNGLKAIGATITEEPEGITITGEQFLEGGATIQTFMDHRIAMSFLIAGLITKNPVAIDSADFIETSFPKFIPLMNQLGSEIQQYSSE